ncbi:Uncharacterized protein KF715C_ch27290 [Pseudomonas putida]|jgi:hypothetical protein|uniref:Uncharacterized protein n=1 Tax=Pseudomonas putida TaxID=303 RepID=A0A1L7ND10_PSEPU|nr:Uncharacterized protein KF715C_ch27290 [Pseudomonas putida]GLO17232.1 hypothetical protein PPUJ20188_06260 [Pseudomonas putida]
MADRYKPMTLADACRFARHGVSGAPKMKTDPAKDFARYCQASRSRIASIGLSFSALEKRQLWIAKPPALQETWMLPH